MAVINAQNNAEAQAQIARLERILLEYEVKLRPRIRREIVRLWRNAGNLNDALTVFEDNIAEILAKAYADAANDVGAYVDSQIENNGSTAVSAAVISGLALFYLDRSQEAAAQIADTEVVNLSTVARRLATEGMTQAEIAAEIRRMAPSYSVARADLIAETEIRAVSDEVTERSFEESGLEFVAHGWIHTRDNRTREDHAEAGRTQSRIPIDQDFIVGGETLRYPRDPRASGKQRYRCRCVRNLYTE